MADRRDGGQAQRQQPRHYPLDIPSLPFNRYDHRRLTARDIIVHRLMAEFMNPSSAYPAVVFRGQEGWFFAHSKRNPRSAPEEDGPDHASGPVQDYELLERLLFTWDTKWMNEWTHPLGGHYQHDVFQGRPNKAYYFGELILDIASRHYLEVDDAAMRVWISRAGLPRMLEGPSAPADADAWPNQRYRIQVSFREAIEGRRHREGLSWDGRHRTHLRRLRQKASLQDQLSLYDGGACLPGLRQTGDMNALGAKKGFNLNHWAINQSMIVRPALPMWPETDAIMRHILQLAWVDRTYVGSALGLTRLAEHRPLDLSLRPGRGGNGDGIWATGRKPSDAHNQDCPADGFDSRRGRPRRRCASEPPPGAFATALLPLPERVRYSQRLQILYPRMTLSQLDKRSRRRSLSRGRIEELFDWGVHPQPSPNAPPPASGSQGTQHCENCTSQAHRTSSCLTPCGHCGAPSPNDPYMLRWDRESPYLHLNPHQAPSCPVARHNRCKCVAFPTFHTAAQCGIPCRRACGDQLASRRPGSFQHRNAMLCRARCCMCGLRGSHSGRECRLRRCRCGGAHLGQDCGWKPECRVPGCDRFLCGVHCQECGSTERPFVGWRCGRCLGVEMPPPVEGEGEEGTKRRGRGRRRGKNGEGGGDGQQAPEDRGETLPVVPTANPPAIVAPLAREEPEKESETEGGFKSIFGDPRAKNSTRTSR